MFIKNKKKKKKEKRKEARKMKYQRRRVDWAKHDKMMLLVACGGAGMASLSREKELQLMRHSVTVSLAIRLVF